MKTFNPTFADFTTPAPADLRAAVVRANQRSALKGLGLAATDAGLLLACSVLTGALEAPATLVLLYLALASQARLYGNSHDAYLGIARTSALAHGLLALLAGYAGLVVSLPLLLLHWGLATVGLIAARFLALLFAPRLEQALSLEQKVFLIGTETELAAMERSGVPVVASHCLREAGDPWYLDIEALQRQGVSDIYVSESCLRPEAQIAQLWQLRTAGIALSIVSSRLAPFAGQLGLRTLGEGPALLPVAPAATGINYWVKRSFDIAVAAILTLALSPLLLALAVLIKLDSPGPVFFRQARLGLHGRQFMVWKFRTMVVDAEQKLKELEKFNEMQDGVLFKMQRDPRVTRLGAFLRRTSLDELPQLFNVLAGQMSLVGPRPFQLRDCSYFQEHHLIRQAVVPGMTGLWQVSGRSEITDFEQVVRLDCQYIRNWSLALDLWILLETVKVVLRRRGAY